MVSHCKILDSLLSCSTAPVSPSTRLSEAGLYCTVSASLYQGSSF